ncbi:hypothetical protein ACFU5O_25325 [Streptomyces sp. NPDC057445]|uniref:hypothetical protein n=1 Tax=Streptomyces sp. NPDC057445 TaxID=3346136 RepID=UPI00368C41E4
MRARMLLWTGVLLCAAGAVMLLVVAVVDLGKADQTASVTGGVVGLVGLALALYAQFGPPSTPPARSGVNASGDGAIAAGGNIGVASTGGGVTGGGTAPTPPSPTPAPPPGTLRQPGNVNASGKGSIAAGGDIGSASTGN